MSLLIMPTPFTGNPSYTMTVTLEGSQYQFQFDFNQRCAAWYMSIADGDGVDIYNGVKLITGFYLLNKCKDIRRPGAGPPTFLPGDFRLLSSTADQSPPGLLDLFPNSGRCTLFYITSDWLQLIQSGQGAPLLAGLEAGLQNTTLSTYGQGG